MGSGVRALSAHWCKWWHISLASGQIYTGEQLKHTSKCYVKVQGLWGQGSGLCQLIDTSGGHISLASGQTYTVEQLKHTSKCYVKVQGLWGQGSGLCQLIDTSGGHISLASGQTYTVEQLKHTSKCYVSDMGLKILCCLRWQKSWINLCPNFDPHLENCIAMGIFWDTNRNVIWLNQGLMCFTIQMCFHWLIYIQKIVVQHFKKMVSPQFVVYYQQMALLCQMCWITVLYRKAFLWCCRSAGVFNIISYRAKGSSKIYAGGPNEHHFLNFSCIFLRIIKVIKGSPWNKDFEGHPFSNAF